HSLSPPPHPGRWSCDSARHGPVPVRAYSARTNGLFDLPAVLDQWCGSAPVRHPNDPRAAPARLYGFAHSVRTSAVAQSGRAPAPSCVRLAGFVDPPGEPDRLSRCGRGFAVSRPRGRSALGCGPRAHSVALLSLTALCVPVEVRVPVAP